MFFVLFLGIICGVLGSTTNGEYLIGVGSFDLTGPAAGVNMMGYANIFQNTAGVHFRLRTRTFTVVESPQGPRFAFVNLDAGMASQENVAISGIHTHAGPGGYLQYLLYSITSAGFVQQSFNAIVGAIKQSIVQAHNNLKPGSVFINKGEVENAGINRSPSAYLFKPAEERDRYPNNVDTQMTLLKFLDRGSGKSIEAFSWYATHETSMSRDNKLISGDNKEIGTLVEKAQTIKATGGQPCGKTTSQAFKVRKNDGSLFVGAFCQSNVGDVTPNVLGAVCTDSGKPCDFNRSSCHGNDLLCVGRGSGYPDEIQSTKIIGESIDVVLDGSKVVKTCPAAVGPGFIAGTTDGPGVFGFQQGDTGISEMWKRLRNSLKEPSPYQVECQKPKSVLLDAGEMFDPYAWAPAILPIQMLRLGKLIVLSVPGEFTTMAGWRLREAVKQTLISNGNGGFDDKTEVVIAGLTNTYSQYVATFEEYEQQRYEAASTLYGPHTLSAYIQEFNKLAKAMAKGEKEKTSAT
ncbi:hypothetical protein I3760_08G073200 [Carya illinoinensis]|nr:hypothetical protein I3760_08G073200 [Carya illinoinensis]